MPKALCVSVTLHFKAIGWNNPVPPQPFLLPNSDSKNRDNQACQDGQAEVAGTDVTGKSRDRPMRI